MDYQEVRVLVASRESASRENAGRENAGRENAGRRLAHGSDPANAEQFQQWPRRGSNPHGGYPPRDFKSRASANSATRPSVPGR